MIYIVTALKPEAQAFVDYYKLKKTKLHDHTLFYNENIKLIISGMGVANARAATQILINHYDITDDDIYANIGICGAPECYNIGELLQCGVIIYHEISYTFNSDLAVLHCVDEEQKSMQDLPVDMESFGFYDAVIHNPAIQNFFVIKIVSDHFQPDSVTKESTKTLLFQQMQAIEKILNSKEPL